MIKVNGQTIKMDKFPDGTFSFKIQVKRDIGDYNVNNQSSDITWYFESNEEMISLMYITRHLKSHGSVSINLIMPYIPNARMDRTKETDDVFTLKYFAEFINSLAFNTVTVLDPHSSVSEALINNIIIESPAKYINEAYDDINNGNLATSLITYYPDEGSMKRYSGYAKTDYAFGIKKRDWQTGKILGLDISGSTDKIKDSNILIVDDISSRGGTFFYSAKKLKDLGANKIYLYVTHCEGTILDGEIFSSGLIEKVYTTNTIFNNKCEERAKELGLSEKFEVFEYEKD